MRDRSVEPSVDQNVDVSFDPKAKPQFEFFDDSVTMGAAGKIIFHQRGASPAWRFKDGEVKDDKLNEFSASVPGDGRVLHINDKFLDKTKTEYEYNITVELDGRRYTSPDPVIVNDPGGGGTGP